MSDGMIVGAGNRDPRTHTDLFVDFFTSHQRIDADRRAIGTTEDDTFHRQSGIERRRSMEPSTGVSGAVVFGRPPALALRTCWI
jgi:hypothetical protein